MEMEPLSATARLRNLAVWVIHGSEDDTILPGYADQMVSALQAIGAPVKYSLLKGAPHNLPADFKQKPVEDWYLEQTRRHAPPPADPLENLEIQSSGFSDFKYVTVPAGAFWKSDSMRIPERRERDDAIRNAEKILFKKIEDRGQLVQSSILRVIDPTSQQMTLWLAVPESLRSKDDSAIVHLPQRDGIRFYTRNDSAASVAHVKEIAAQLMGRTLSNEIWITILTPSRRPPNFIAEYWIELK